MDWLVFAGIVVLVFVFGYIAQHFGWIDMTNKSRRSGGTAGALGIGDEVFHPTRHEAQVELDRQTVLPAPAPLPGDGPLGVSRPAGVYEGRLRIDLDAARQGRRSAGGA